MVPAVASYSVAAVQPIHGGRWPGGRLYGSVDLGGIAPGGPLVSQASTVDGVVVLADAVPAGDLRGFVMPGWLSAAAVREWVAVPASTLANAPAWDATPTPGFWGTRNAIAHPWNGTGLDEDTSTIWQFGGGHSDYAGNELLSLCLESETPVWLQRCPRSATSDMKFYGSGGADYLWNLDGKPASVHIYQGSHFLRHAQKYLAIDGVPWYQAASRRFEPVTFNLAAGAWDPQGTWAAHGVADGSTVPGVIAKHPITEDIYFLASGAYKFLKLDTRTKVWSTLNSNMGTEYGPVTECGAVDSARNRLMVLTNFGGPGLTNFRFYALDCATGALSQISLSASAALTSFQAGNTRLGSLNYAPELDRFFYYFGSPGTNGRIWQITPNGTNTWDISELTMTGATVPAGTTGASSGNLLSRFRWIPRLGAVMAFVAADQPIYMARMI